MDGDYVMADLSASQQKSLQLVLEEYEARYDPVAYMVTSEASKVGYHSTISGGSVHPTRESLAYAVALLDSGEQDHLERAISILKTVIALQDQNPESKTYGIWSWYLEEPLDKMAPPDWNWADFCGVQLLAAYRDHNDRLPEDLSKQPQRKHHPRRAIHRTPKHGTALHEYRHHGDLCHPGDRRNIQHTGSSRLRQESSQGASRIHHLSRFFSTNTTARPIRLSRVKEFSRILMDAQDDETKRLMKETHDLAVAPYRASFSPADTSMGRPE